MLVPNKEKQKTRRSSELDKHSGERPFTNRKPRHISTLSDLIQESANRGLVQQPHPQKLREAINTLIKESGLTIPQAYLYLDYQACHQHLKRLEKISTGNTQRIKWLRQRLKWFKTRALLKGEPIPEAPSQRLRTWNQELASPTARSSHQADAALYAQMIHHLPPIKSGRKP